MNWMTVKNLSDYLQLSEIALYKWVQQGKIPFVKAGRVLRFDRENIDRWLKTRESLPKKQSILPFDEALENFLQELKNTFSDRLKQVILYGSWARGEQNEGSDVDLFVVLDNLSFDRSEIDLVRDIAYNVTFGKGRVFVFSVMVIEEKKFLMQSSPLLVNLRREGQRLL